VRTSARRPASCDGVSIATAWTVVTLAALVVAAYRPEWFPLPSYHFLFYLSVSLCIWFGIALTAIVDTVAARFDRRVRAGAVVLLIAVLAVWAFPQWDEDMTNSRDDALAFEAHFDDFAAVDWIRKNTDDDDVFVNAGGANFIGDGQFLQFFPGVAGRFSVNIDSPEFSSPWVDWRERHDDARAMVRALAACRIDRFEALAEPYGRVRFFLVPVRTNPGLAGLAGPGCREQAPVVYRDDAVAIHRVDASTAG
jgi:hypothetical protein